MARIKKNKKKAKKKKNIYISGMEKNNKDIPVQGAEVITGKDEQIGENVANVEKKEDVTEERKISTSGTIRSFRKVIVNLKVGKMAEEEELTKMMEIYNTIFDRWMGKEMKF